MNALPDRYATDDLVLHRPGDGLTLAQRLTKRYSACITGTFMVPGREGNFAPLPDDLPPALAQALRTRGITQLYSHQASRTEQVDHSNRSTVITAPDPDHGATTGRNRPSPNVRGHARADARTAVLQWETALLLA